MVYFVGKILFKPTELVALVFEHLFSIIPTPLLNNHFAATVNTNIARTRFKIAYKNVYLFIIQYYH